MSTPDPRLEWFAGDADALALYEAFSEIAHIWDDMVDRDCVVPAERINRAFRLALIDVSCNPVFHRHYEALRPMLVSAVACYEAANQFEQDRDAHGLELAHVLRYAVAQVFVYLITVSLGEDRARAVLPQALKRMMPERMFIYLKEHGYAPFAD